MNFIKCIVLFLIVIASAASAQEKLNRDVCRQLAIGYNQDIKSAKLETKSFEASKSAAETEYYPTLDFTGNYHYVGKPYIIESVFETLKSRYELNARLTQPIYTGGRISSEFALRESYENIARENETLTASNLIYQTDNVYWATVAANENLFSTGLYLSTIQDLFEVIKNKVEAELISKNDQLITEVRLNDAKLLLLESENRLRISKMELNRLIGYEITKPIEVENQIFVDNYEYDFDNLIDRAIVQRPELLMQLQNIEANQYSEDLTSSKYLPQWFFGAHALWGVPSPDLTSNPEFNYSIYTTVAVPIFLWNRSSLDVESQELLTESEKEQLQKLKEIVSLEVQSSKYTYDEAIKRVELTTTSLHRAIENLDIMTTRYVEGLSPILEVLDAQVFWYKAYTDNIDAKRRYQVSYSALLKSIGELHISE